MKRAICLLLTALLLLVLASGCKNENKPKITRISVSESCGVIPTQVEVYGAASGGNETGGPTGGVNNLEYVWDFGDGSSATSIAYHTYLEAGLHTITLTVRDQDGATDKNFVNFLAIADSLDIVVTNSPDSGITTSTPVVLDYTAASCDINPDLEDDYVKLNSTWFVDDPAFPDGVAVYTGRSPVHTFSAPGTYDVRLNVYYPAWDVWRNVTRQIVVAAP